MLSNIEEIKSKLDLVEFISSYLKLTKTGANYRALCPFHQEKTPSFFVSPINQIWHCFGGCSEGGDIFKFVMKLEGVDFKEALRILADKAGVELKSEDYQLKSERIRLYEINEKAAEFFIFNLGKNNVVYEYLRNRGLKRETINEFKIGYALNNWRAMLDHLKNKGYKVEDIERAGLIIRNASESNYDRFRNRIMFPIFDINSRIVGFSGRVFGNACNEEFGGKYINSPETLIYKKSFILYGLDKAKLAIKTENQCVLVEGQLDLIMSHQAGVINTVATSGTALTNQHLSIIKRYTDNLVFAFDSDKAGILAANRGIDLAVFAGFNVKTVLIDKKDPADFILENGKEAWQAAIKNSSSIMDHHFRVALKDFDLNTLDGKKNIANFLLKEIKKIPNSIEVAYWLSKLAEKIDIKEEHLLNDLKNLKSSIPILSKNDLSFDKIEKGIKSRLDILGERLLLLLIKEPAQIFLIKEMEFLFEDSYQPKLAPIFRALKDWKGDPIIEIKVNLPEHLKDYFNNLLLQSEILGEEFKDSIKEIKLCLKELKTSYLKENLRKLNFKIKGKEFKNETEEDLIKKLQLLIYKLNKTIHEEI